MGDVGEKEAIESTDASTYIPFFVLQSPDSALFNICTQPFHHLATPTALFTYLYNIVNDLLLYNSAPNVLLQYYSLNNNYLDLQASRVKYYSKAILICT